MLDRSRKAARCESGLSKRSLAMEFSDVLLEPNEAAAFLKVSLSWLAKARMRGDGPPYIRIGRSIRYTEAALMQWMKSRQRTSTSEQ
jgi:predicted DNA-binding transcriptional regulator AlpA